VSDNKINFGVDFAGEGFQKAQKMLETGINSMASAAKGVEKSFSSAFGDATIRSLTAITTKFEKLSALMQKISGQSQGLGQSIGNVGGVNGPLGSAPSQIPIYDASGNVIKTISTAGPMGGGGGDGGAGPNGGNSPPPPPKPLIDPISAFFKAELYGRGIEAVRQGFDFFRPYGGLDLQQYQRSQYGMREALHGDASRRLIDQAFGGVTSGDKISAGLGSLAAAPGGAVGGAVLGGAIGSVIPILGTAVGAGVGALVGGGISAVSSFIPGLNKARDQRYQQFENVSQSLRYGRSFISDMSNAEQLYGREGIDSMMSGAAIYGDEEARAAINRNRRYGARGGINVGLAADQRYGLGGLADSAAFSGQTLGGGAFNLAKGMLSQAGFSPAQDIAAIENISNAANQYSQNSGLGLRGDEISALQGGFFGVAGAGRAAGLSASEQGQAVAAGQKYGQGLLGSTIGFGKAYSTLKAQGVSDLQAQALINAGIFTMNAPNAQAEFKRITGRNLDAGAFKAGVKDLYDTGYNILGATSEKDKALAAEVFGGSKVAGLGIQGLSSLADLAGQSPAEREALRARGATVAGTRETRDQELRRLSADEVKGLIGDLSNVMEDFSRIIPQAAEEFRSKINGERTTVRKEQAATQQRQKTITQINGKLK
jgi:hypothetical protein